MKTPALALLVTMTCFVENSHAQLQNVTVQLPTYHYFGVSTTVSVPDRGGLYMGGVNRSRWGRRGRATSAGGMSINATIIDHDAMDRALLAEAARRRPVVAAPKAPRDIVAQRWRATR